jgi:hypothetical protein
VGDSLQIRIGKLRYPIGVPRAIPALGRSGLLLEALGHGIGAIDYYGYQTFPLSFAFLAAGYHIDSFVEVGDPVADVAAVVVSEHLSVLLLLPWQLLVL